MKTFNEKDLITWANREKAVIGNEYYFADCLDDMECKIKKEEVCKLICINDNEVATTFKNSSNSYLYACILPVEAVKEEKKYRPCKSLREFYRVVMNEVPTLNMLENDIIYDLINSIIHIRNTKSGIEFHLNINGIRTDLDGTRKVLIGNSYLSYEDLFDNFEVEINYKWLPFGVSDDQMFDDIFEKHSGVRCIMRIDEGWNGN